MPKQSRFQPKKAKPEPPAVIEMERDPQEQRFVAAYVQTSNIAEAARAAGVHPITGYRWMKRPNILAGIQDAFRRAGIDEDALAKVALDALTAKKTLMLPDGQGGVSPLEVPDHAIRLRAFELLANTTLKMDGKGQNDGDDEPLDEELPDLNSVETEEIIALIAKRTRRHRG